MWRLWPLALVFACRSDSGVKRFWDDPEVSILSPSARDTFAEGMSVTVQARLTHDFETTLGDDHDWIWSSDVSGGLAGTTTFVEDEDLALFETTELELGAQLLTVEVSPSTYSADPSSDNVLIEVIENTPPSIAILEPADGAVIEAGLDVEVLVEVSDETEPDLTALPLQWELDCADVSGAPAAPEADGSAGFTLTGLAVGACALSVSVEDALGLRASASVGFEVAELDHDGDGYIREDFGGDDCNDSDADVNPGAGEICDDSIDNDCDGEWDECGLAGDHELDLSAVVIYGSSGTEHLGVAIASGDYDGDGVADLLVGAPGYDSDGGAAWLVSGPVADGTAVVTDIVSWSYLGTHTSMGVGAALADGADIDGDGRDDLFVGAPGYDGAAGSSTGAVLVLGPDDERADLLLEGGESGEDAGSAIATTDLDADGLTDLLVGAPLRQGDDNNRGYLYVLYGPTTASQVLGDGDGYVVFGATRGEKLGAAVVALGDMNGDDYADYAIGAPVNDDADTEAGVVYVVMGSSARGSSNLDAASAATLVLTGPMRRAAAGQSLAAPGDMNGDGRADLLVGAPGYGADTDSGANTGAVFIVTGGGDMTGTHGLGEAALAPAVVVGSEAGDDAGTAIAGGDVTGDGCPELLLGVPGYDGTRGYAALFGCAGELLGTTAAEDAEARFLETDADSKAGAAVHASADLNGDGRTEVMVGAPENNGDGRSGAGAVYVVFGKEL